MYDGDIFEHKGHSFRVNFPSDDVADTPWDREDGHGPVSDWTTRAKRPGEVILASDRSSHRFYDMQAAVKLAAKDWCEPGGSRARAAAAAREDFDRLKDWCDDRWCYIGVDVVMLDEDGEPVDVSHASLWGIESDAGDYLETVARELADELIAGLMEVTTLGEPVI